MGYVFVDGRWDYPLDQRGMLFTPVAFQSPLYQQAGFSYSPGYLIDLGLLADNLFVNPAFQDYCFGDYYGNQYQQAGIYPWYAVGTGAYLYDPIFGYQSWFDARRNPHWRDELTQRYARLVKDPAARPPRTWQDEQRLARAGAGPGRTYRPLAVPVAQALRDNRLGGHLVRVNNAQRRDARQNTDVRRRLALDRSRARAAHSPGQAGNTAESGTGSADAPLASRAGNCNAPRPRRTRTGQDSPESEPRPGAAHRASARAPTPA